MKLSNMQACCTTEDYTTMRNRHSTKNHITARTYLTAGRWLIAAILLLAPLHSRAEEFMFRHLEAKDGLSNNQILDIHRDSEGFVWFATVSGLNRYDGVQIKTFFSSESDTTAIPDSYVKTIQEDADGRLWLNTGSGYAIYYPDTETFSRCTADRLAWAGIQYEPELVYIDNDKNIWLYIYGQGCFCIKAGSYDECSVHIDRENMPQGNVTGMSQCSEGILMVYSDGTLACLDPTDGSINWVNNDVAYRLDPGISDIFTLFVDRDDDIWIYSPFGVWMLDNVQGRRRAHSRPLSRTPESNNMVHAVAQDAQGRIWIGKDTGGIEIFDKSTGEIKLLYNTPEDESSLQSNNIMALYYDSNEIMWVGTFKKGISYYNESLFKFKVRHIGDVNCFEEDSPGHVWIGTNDAGLIYWDTATGKPIKTVSKKDGLGSDAVVCMLKTRDGCLWVGSFWGGLDCLDNGRLTHYSHIEGKDNSLVHNNVWSLVEDSDGKIWIGTLGGGVQMFNPRTGEFTCPEINLPTNSVVSMCLGKDDILWIGTSGGIRAYNIKTKEVSRIEQGENHLSNENISQIFVDSRGLVWAGTLDGLNVYNPKTGEIDILDVNEGLPSPVVSGIAEDDNKTILVTTAWGVVNIFPTVDLMTGKYSYSCQLFNDKDGIRNCEFNQRSIKKLSSGEILMGGANGVYSFHPNEIRYNRILPNVIFTGFSLFNEEVAIGEEYKGRVILDKAINRTEQIKLKYEQNIFSVRFASDNYILPEKTTYLYRLDGFNEDWTSTTEQKVTYTNLSPGTYTLRVKAINSDGYYNGNESTLKIIIRPPFRLSVWAFLIYILAAIAIVGIISIIIARNERGKFRLQQIKQAAERNQEVNDMKLRFFTNISHELRTPLTLIVTPLESLIKDYSSDDVLTDKLKIIQRNVIRLSNMVTQLLDFRKSDVSGHHLHLSEGEIVSYIDSICNSFVSLADRKDVHLTFYSSVPFHNMAFDEDKIGKVVTNLLSNAFKFTPKGGRVDVAISVLHGKENSEVLEIKVADTGIGVKDEDKKRIFDRFYQVDNPGLNASGSGIGLNLAYDFVTLHGGSITVSDNVPRGAVFIVCIPVRHTEAGAVAAEAYIETPNEIPSGTAEGKENLTKSLMKERKASGGKNDNRPIVLVVDDNDDFLTFMYESLSKDYNVKLATNGKEAWEMLSDMTPDIIISDVMMPQMDGNELCRLVKSEKRTMSIPFILLTARHSYEYKLEGLTVGADDYITKPFSMDILQLRIQKLLDLRAGQHHSHIDPSPSEIEITSMDEKLIERAVNFVEKKMSSSELSVEQLSTELGMSRVNLYKKLLAITGRTPIEFIRIIRLKRAAQLLRESQLNVSEIAYQVGFNSPKYFAKHFKEEFGQSPSAYQAQHSRKS